MGLPAYEKLGVFYLGREFDPKTQQLGAELLYDSRDLTTHAVCIGMTGSGKTGLCLSLLEEAALDGVPVPSRSTPRATSATCCSRSRSCARRLPALGRRGRSRAQGTVGGRVRGRDRRSWRKGLAEWGQDGARIARLRAAAEVAIYTPGSTSGRPLSILRSFAAPDAAVAGDATALKERIGAAVAGLLGLLGIEADPIKQPRAHPALGVLDAAWRKGQGLDLAGTDPGGAEAAFRQGRRIRPRDLLPGEGSHRACAAA